MQSKMADSVPTPCKFEQTMLSDVCLVQDPQDVRRISNSEGLVTLTLDQVILHTIMHHSSTSTYMPNIKEIEKTFCEWTDGHTHGILETGSIRSTLSKSRPNDSVTCSSRVLFSVHYNPHHHHITRGRFFSTKYSTYCIKDTDQK